MTNRFKLALCFSAALPFSALAQTPLSDSNQSASLASTSPVAYVYVSRTVGGGTEYQIEGFAAGANGKLTTISGSPFQEDVKNMAVNGKFLFATNHTGTNIETFRMEPNGSLRYATTTEVETQSRPHTLGPLFLDHTGTWLYDAESNVGAFGNFAYQSFAVDKPIGDVKSMGDSNANSWLNSPAAFIGNNRYAYSASCLQNMYWGIFGFRRTSSGMLKDFDPQATPPPPADGDFFCPSQAAADPTDHVAISMQPISQADFTPDGPPRLAVYTANASGTLTTESTLENMPSASVGAVEDLKMSPSGKLLAVGGSLGLQIYHFNGASPVTSYTGLLATDDIAQFFWDNRNHLYAISSTAGKLYVFTVTPEGYAEAPDSPYRVEDPQDIIVQPKTAL
jgi:hypothetical protein